MFSDKILLVLIGCVAVAALLLVGFNVSRCMNPGGI